MELLKKFFATLKPFYDFRVWLLALICLGVGWLVDPAVTLGLAGYLAYVVGMSACRSCITSPLSATGPPPLSSRRAWRS